MIRFDEPCYLQPSEVEQLLNSGYSPAADDLTVGTLKYKCPYYLACLSGHSVTGLFDLGAFLHNKDRHKALITLLSSSGDDWWSVLIAFIKGDLEL